MRIGIGGAITVTATDIWLSEMRAGRAFVAGDVQLAVAAQSPHLQLLNPVGSAIQIIGRFLIVSSSVALALYLRRYDTALTTAAGTEANLLVGGAAPTGQLRKQTNATMLGTQLAAFFIGANSPVVIAPDWIMELGPGEGWLLTTSTANIDLEANFFWREV